MPHLHTILLHSETLPFRKEMYQTTMKVFEEISKKIGYKYHSYTILDHDPLALRSGFSEIEKTIEYNKIGDEDFDKCIQTLNMEQISNFFKQRSALQKVLELAEKETGDDQHLYVILEDDAMILPEFYQNLSLVLQKPFLEPWDILLLCSSLPDKTVTNYQLVDVRQMGKVLPSKEAYAITPETAKEILRDFQKIHYTYRFQLSHWIYTHPTIRVKCPTIRVSIEGSKVGFVPSSVCENNVLIYNQEFMELFKMMLSGNIDFQKAKQLYKTVEHLKSPEVMHIYGVLLFKLNRKDQAKEMFLEAVNQMIAKNGCINARTELLNNAINIHGMVQEDLEIFRKYPSKYAEVVFYTKGV